MAIYDFLVKVNGTDVSSLGLKVASLEGNWDSPGQRYDEAVLAGRSGTVRTTRKPVVEALDFTVTGELQASTESAFEDAVDTLKFLLGVGDTTIIGGNRDARQRTGSLLGSVRITPDQTDHSVGQVRFTIRCEDPFAYDTSVTTVSGAAATDLACAQGTHETAPVITVTSPTSPLTITYKSYAGASIAAPVLSFPGSPTTVVLDCAARTVTVDGTRHDEYLTADDFFMLDPHDGDYTVSHWPTVRVSSGSPSIAYRKAYR